jgi:hypothetical protein
MDIVLVHAEKLKQRGHLENLGFDGKIANKKKIPYANAV